MQYALAVIEAQRALASLARIYLDAENISQQTPSQLGDTGALRSTVPFELSPSANAPDKLHFKFYLLSIIRAHMN
jgi:hypothetical protein